MRLLASRIGIIAAIVLATAASCSTIKLRGTSPLVRPQMSPDSVVLDIFFVRFPFGDEEANFRLWQEIDELHFPMEVRRQLARNGFRAGVVAGQIPVTLSRLLELNETPPSSEQTSQIELADMESMPTVVRRHKQLRAEKRCEIPTSSIYEELPVVTCESGDLFGHSYPKAQGVLAAKAFPEPGGGVRLELVPELHYGDPRWHYVGTQGAFRLDASRPRRVFHELALTAQLAPGDMLVMSSLDCRPGSLGHHFFTHDAFGQLEQKLLVIRLSQTQHDELFAPSNLLPLNELEQ